jgi:MFS family permease
MRVCSEGGFPDDISTYAIVSGVWASAFALGAFIGPSMGGVLLDYVGFRWGSMVIVAIHCFAVSGIVNFTAQKCL